MSKNKGGRTLGPSWTPMLRDFWKFLKEGKTQTEAARLAGYKNPADKACHLIRNPLIVVAREEQRAIERKAEEKNADKHAEEIVVSKAWVLKRLVQLAAMEPKETNNNITGQVRAALGLAEVLGMRVGPQNPDKFEGFTNEELEQYVKDGTVPERYASRFGITPGGPTKVM